ncbi:hypothetical protein DPEC_G00351860 [Dallia pectoralis]|uniref:Uncharacterized protein n=1 Tax=Dallia pectoralis TaxID=75939 RepID=A0ACC2F220_DALPE|nr:hypothetical protein DPEC_G00351860 [Dallia pectoralis]
MKIILLVALFLVLANVLSQEIYLDENWTECHEKSIGQPCEPYKEILKRMIRKPGSRPFFRPKGNRAKPQFTSRKQRLESFVGLMGKRSSEEQGPF